MRIYYVRTIVGTLVRFEVRHYLLAEHLYLTLYRRETHFNAFAKRADQGQEALTRVAGSLSTMFADGNKIRYGPTIVDLAFNLFVLFKNVKAYLYYYS